MGSSLTPHGHQYSNLIVRDEAHVHQGDVYHQNIVLERPKADVQNKHFGLCLGDAPSISPDAFKGREDDLKVLHDYLQPAERSGPRRVVSIVGTGGLGKTQLSLAYARIYAHHYSSIFWLNANDETTLRQGIASLAKIVFPDPGDKCHQTPEAEKLAIERVRQWLSESTNDQWLLILDNYDNPLISESQSPTDNCYDIRRFFPIRSQGSVLITTRSTKIFFSQQLQLKEIQDVSVSVSILSQRSNRDLSTDPQATDLAQRLCGLPLALATAGAFLASTTMSCSEYHRLYETRWTNLFGPDAEELSEYPQRTLATTWSISLEHVRAQDEDSAELLEFLAFFSPRDIWYELIKAGANDETPSLQRLRKSQIRFQQAVSKLRECCLIDVVAGSYQIHPCLHDWLVGKLQPPLSRPLFTAALKSVRKRVSLARSSEAAIQNRRLLDHIEHLQSRHFLAGWDAYFDDEKVYEAASRFAWLLSDYGFWTRAETMCHMALKGKERALGPRDILVLEDTELLVYLYMRQHKLDKAEQTLQWALPEILQKCGLTIESSLEISTQRDSQHGSKGMIDMLEQFSVQLLEGRGRILIPHANLVFRMINTLAGIYKKQERRTEAIQIDEWLLVEGEKLFGSDDTNLLIITMNLAETLVDQGKLDMAKDHLVRALAKAEDTHGLGDRWTLSIVRCLGHVHKLKNELGKAEPLLTRALAGTEALLGPEHPGTLQTKYYLGSVYCLQGQYRKAEQMLTQALIGRQKTFGQDNVRTLDSMQAIGNLYLSQRRFEEAEQTFLQVLAGYERIFGTEHAKLLFPLEGLRQLFTTQQNWRAAKQYEQRISVIEEVNGLESELMIASIARDLYGKIQSLSMAQMIATLPVSIMRCFGERATKSRPRSRANLGQRYELDTLLGTPGDETDPLIVENIEHPPAGA